MTPSDETRVGRLLSRIAEIAPDDPKLQAYLAELEREIAQSEQASAESDKEKHALEEAYHKLTAPANRIGVFLKHLDDGQALVALGETEYAALIDPKLEKPEELNPGVRVRLNDAYAVVGTMADSVIGSLVKVAEVLEDGRIRLGGDQPGLGSRLVQLSETLKGAKISAGDEVRLDPSGHLAIEHLPKNEANELFIEEVPDVSWRDVGGQEAAMRTIRESIEQPMLYPEIYEKFGKKPVKGILLYGPPGCGKTLIGKAIASSLAEQAAERKGEEVEECFLHISGPKILNMWLGETERMVREIFSAAREKAKEGRIVVVFIDEAESILRTRSGGRWLNISNTVVPQFCAELDGMVELENVVLVITSNRPDYIDPAILRPERIDRRVKISRPNREGCRSILGIHFDESVPIDPKEAEEHDGAPCARKAFIEATLAWLYREEKETEQLVVRRRGGAAETLYWKDLVSGALLKSVVDRAKDYAIRRAISDPKGQHGLKIQDLKDALAAEYQESEIFPKSDVVEDWLKLIDIDPEDVAAVQPVRGSQRESGFGRAL
jgi:proteasome-associated ATPase